MKSKTPLRNFLLAAFISLLAISSASAQLTYTWDISGAGVIVGGTGAWNTSNSFWTTDAGLSNTSWTNAAGTPKNNAIFGGTAGTVTLAETIELRNLNFTHTTGVYTITGSTLAFTGGTITAPTIASGAAGTNFVTIRSNITGAPNLNIQPMAGDLVFTLNPVDNGSMVIGAVTGDGGNGSERLSLQGGTGSTGTITSTTGPKVLVSGGSWTINGTSSGRDHNISGGTLTLNANLNATARAVILSGGVLNYNVASAVSASVASAISSDNGFRITGGTLDNTSGAAINTNASTTHIDLAGTLTFAGTNGANSNLHLGSGPVWLKGGNRQITVTNAATRLTIGGVIQNDSTPGRGLTKAGAGTLDLRGNSTYSGATTISAGSLVVGDTVASTTVLNSSVTADATSDFITLTGNTLVDGNKVVFGGTTVPTGLTAGTVYFVRETSGNTFKVAATSGGPAINLTGAGTAVTATRPGALGSTNTAIVLGDATTTTNNSSPTLLTSGAFTNERPITIANQATSGVYTIGGSNTSGTATYTGAITLNRALTLLAATGGTVNFQSAFATNNNAIAIGSSGNLGTVRINNAIATSGGMNVNFGTLELNSAFTGGNMAVASGTTLSGNGSVAGTTGVTSGTVNGTGLTLTGLTTFNSTGNTLSGTVSTNASLASAAALALNGALTGTLDIGNGTLTGIGGSVSSAATLNGGIVNLTSGTLNSTLGVTGGSWNGNGSVTGLITSSSGTFNIGNGANLTANNNLDVTGGTLVAGNSSSTITGSLNYTSSSNSTFAGIIAGSGKTLTMNSANTTLNLSGANTYTGATSVNAGTLRIHGSTSASSNFTVASGGTLGGSGTIGGTVTLESGSTLAPGASIESLATGNNVWNGGSTYQFEFSTDGSTGTAGVEWDLLAIAGTLDLTGASSSNPITFDLVSMLDATQSGLLGSWNSNANATWAGIVTTTGGITGFASNLFTFDTTGFQNPLNGNFSLVENGNNLDLTYTVIPEPKAVLLGCLGVLLLLRRRR